MSLLASPRLRAAVWLAPAGLIAGLAAGRPEPVAVAAPFALVALFALARRQPRPLSAAIRLDTLRAGEGDRVEIEVELHSQTAADRIEAQLLLPPGLAREDAEPAAFALAAGETATLPATIRCDRWGAYRTWQLRVRRYDRLRLAADEQTLELHEPLRVYPHAETLRALARPFQTQAAVGDQLARTKGEGIELAELRPFVAGDDLRRVNWRASARFGDLVVNDHHPERNTAVVLLLDALALLEGPRRQPLDDAVAAAWALAERYLDRRDRVGLLALGGRLRWLRPASGRGQLYRIVDALLDVQPPQPGRERVALAIPSRLLPPKALVLALTPLLDDRIVGVLRNLRGRGFDLAVVEIDPLAHLDADPDALAPRLVALERGLLRSRLRARGIAVVEWNGERPLEAAIRTMEDFRRRARVARA